MSIITLVLCNVDVSYWMPNSLVTVTGCPTLWLQLLDAQLLGYSYWMPNSLVTVTGCPTPWLQLLDAQLLGYSYWMPNSLVTVTGCPTPWLHSEPPVMYGPSLCIIRGPSCTTGQCVIYSYITDGLPLPLHN